MSHQVVMTARGRGAVLLTGTLGAVRGMAGNMGYCVSKHATPRLPKP